MKLTTQEEYGLRCLLQIARRGESASLTIGELSQAEGISAPNVAKIMRILRRRGLVNSTRGKSGGYSLSRSAERIPVGEVVGALGGRIFDATFCDRHSGGTGSCANTSDCSIRPVLRHLQEAIDGVLGELTVASLLSPEREVSGAMAPRRIPLSTLRPSRV